MKVFVDITLEQFDAWQGGKHTKERIISEDKQSDFEFLIDELYPDGLEDTQLNDLLRFDSDYIYESLGMELEE